SRRAVLSSTAGLAVGAALGACSPSASRGSSLSATSQIGDTSTTATTAQSSLPSSAVTTAAPPIAAGARRRFDGLVVAITGGTSGIGRATAMRFAAEGAAVGFCGRREQLGQQVEAEIRAAGGEATYVRADVRLPDDVDMFTQRVIDTYGGLDVAFDNAGIGQSKPLADVTLDEWEDLQNTNVRGVFLAIKSQVPHLRERGGGVIVVTSSSAALVARPGGGAYSASKRALQGIVQAAALEYGSDRIRVLAVMPGTTDTPFVRPPGFEDSAWADFKARWGATNVDGLGRMAEPDEIASAVVALAGQEFSYLTGSSVEV